MAEVTIALVKELRERTGIGMGKCKEALTEANGDINLAIDNLRKSGMASAVKKEGREVKEGVIGTGSSDSTVAIVEINSETDFVAKNDKFQEFVATTANEIAKTKPSSLDAFLQQNSSSDPSFTVDQVRAGLVQTIGENIQIKRLKVFDLNSGVSVGVYSHLGGKIVTVVEIQGSNKHEALAKDIAMHVAASAPEYLSPEKVPQEIIEHEKEIAKEQVKTKPANVIDKIVEGKVNSFLDANCLSKQKYIRDDSMSIEQLIEKAAKDSGEKLVLSNFVRWCVGQ